MLSESRFRQRPAQLLNFKAWHHDRLTSQRRLSKSAFPCSQIFSLVFIAQLSALSRQQTTPNRLITSNDLVLFHIAGSWIRLRHRPKMLTHRALGSFSSSSLHLSHSTSKHEIWMKLYVPNKDAIYRKKNWVDGAWVEWCMRLHLIFAPMPCQCDSNGKHRECFGSGLQQEQFATHSNT